VAAEVSVDVHSKERVVRKGQGAIRLDTFADAVARANRANEELLQGRAAALKALFSHREDISVLGGFGGHEVGWAAIGPRLDWVAEEFAGGHFEYEHVVSAVGTDMGLVVQLERGEVRYRGADAPARLELRVTMLFRREDGTWRLVSRHADEQIQKKSPARTA
jgi:ketosteroid isomerase-like protein